MKYVIFSIDNQHSAFWRGVLAGMFKGAQCNLVPCIGSYNGETEFSWLCTREDFDNLVAGTSLIDKQESIMAISECNKQYAQLEFLDARGHTKGIQPLGSLKSVSEEEAHKHTGWTYRPDMGTYWVAVKGNPDTVSPDSGWLSAGQVKALDAAHGLIEAFAKRCPGPNGAEYRAVASNLSEAFSKFNGEHYPNKRETLH